MAHSRSARKRVRTAARRTEINRARRSRVRTFIKKVRGRRRRWRSVRCPRSLTAAQPEIMRGVTKGTMHKNTASRKISRLSAAVKRMA